MFGKMGRMYAIYVERGQRACSRMLSELLFEPLGVLYRPLLRYLCLFFSIVQECTRGDGGARLSTCGITRVCTVSAVAIVA